MVTFFLIKENVVKNFHPMQKDFIPFVSYVVHIAHINVAKKSEVNMASRCTFNLIKYTSYGEGHMVA
jgi:hypothetical protein